MKGLTYILLILFPLFGRSQVTIDKLFIKAEQKQNNLPELIEIYSQVLKLDSCNYEALLGQGNAYYSRWKILGRVDKIYLDSAFIQLNKACNVNNVDYRAFVARGYYYADFENFKEAFNDFSKAIERKSDLYHVRWRRGLISMKWKDYESAIADLTIAVNYYGNEHDRLYINRAKCYANIGMLSNCKKDVDKAISINSKSNENILALADYHAISGEYKKAIKKYSYIINRNSAFALAYLKRGSVYYAIGQSEKAENDWFTANKKGIAVNEKTKKIRFGK